MARSNHLDPKLPSYTDRCKCSSCGEYFNSTHAFTKHRVGSYQPISRRCLTADEMRSKGWSLNATGHWITATRSPGDEIAPDSLRTPRVTPSASPSAEAA